MHIKHYQYYYVRLMAKSRLKRLSEKLKLKWQEYCEMSIWHGKMFLCQNKGKMTNKNHDWMSMSQDIYFMFFWKESW